VKLELPVFHVGYFDKTVKILKQICKVMPDLYKIGMQFFPSIAC